MARPRTGAFPPTPAPSTELRGKPSAPSATTFDSSFTLPPAALGGHGERSKTTSSPSTSAAEEENASDSSYRPLSPRSPIDFATSSSKPSAVAIAPKSDPSRARQAPRKAKLLPARRKRAESGAARVKQQDEAEYTLPPPPTRKRKIIQMNPGTQQDAATGASPGQAERRDVQHAPVLQPPATKASANSSGAGGKKGGAGSKRKQNTGADGKPTTAAGRKIARKTAHSLIERRRRSKMNEEFGVLKDLIPACRGQEMHKLAILQVCVLISCPGRDLPQETMVDKHRRIDFLLTELICRRVLST